jgi:hypothetical protein
VQQVDVEVFATLGWEQYVPIAPLGHNERNTQVSQIPAGGELPSQLAAHANKVAAESIAPPGKHGATRHCSPPSVEVPQV